MPNNINALSQHTPIVFANTTIPNGPHIASFNCPPQWGGKNREDVKNIMLSDVMSNHGDIPVPNKQCAGGVVAIVLTPMENSVKWVNILC
jgi:hypothetical protein